MKKMYKPVIGLEVHVELNTKSKMFCGCSADYFGKEPNSHTCPVCLGIPGALPYINEEAIKKCLMIGIALNCKVSQDSLFERKNYFYPDLSKGFQTSQYRWPLTTGGFLEINTKDGGKKKIRINRVHQEEDTGKLMHSGSDTVIDFNRSGVPLVEIVTEPDFSDSEQVKNYGKLLQQILRDLGVSNADMEKGDMRLEANVSVREVGDTKLPNYRVELKNINSFRFMAQAIEYEIKRQSEALENGETLYQETRGWDEGKQKTFEQRKKEEANDYRYFPEPDLPLLRVKSLESRIKGEMPKLSTQIIAEVSELYGISKSTISIILSKNLLDLFLGAIKEGGEPRDIANYLVNSKVESRETPLDIVNAAKSKKPIFMEDEAIELHVDETIKQNPSIVDQYKSGKEASIQVLVGMVMRKTQGKAEGTKVLEILRKKLT